MRRILLPVGLVLLLMLAGCASTPTQPVETNQVEMPKSYRFDPTAIIVAVGTEVTWHNGDNFTHSVKFDQNFAPDLVLEPGESGSVRFDQAGEYTYYCTFHAQQMKGTVIVHGN